MAYRRMLIAVRSKIRYIPMLDEYVRSTGGAIGRLTIEDCTSEHLDHIQSSILGKTRDKLRIGFNSGGTCHSEGSLGKRIMGGKQESALPEFKVGRNECTYKSLRLEARDTKAKKLISGP